MYNGHGGATTMNNPFAPHPAGTQSRFPDISGGIDPQYTASSFGSQNQGFQQPQQPQQQQYMYQQQPQQQMGGQQQYGLGMMSPTYGTGYLSPVSPQIAQPTGWNAPQISGSSYSYLNGQQQQQQPQYVSPAQQQIQNNPGYVAQFDPYGSLSQGWDGSNPTPGSGSIQSSSSTSILASPAGVSHPREFIRTNKSAIDAWDPYAWKQLISAFDSVKDSWASRKKEIEQRVQQFMAQMQYGGGGYHPMQIQQEVGRLQSLAKDADAHSDTAAAASFQLAEVFENYRKSGDPASKKRVREACNATLNGCPDWPPAVY